MHGVKLNPEKRDRLSNYRAFDYTLWSDAPEIEAGLVMMEAIEGLKVTPKRHTQLKVLLLNLLDTFMIDASKYIGIHRNSTYYSKDLHKRYNPSGISRILLESIDTLFDEGLIENHPGHYNYDRQTGVISRIKAKPHLMFIPLIPATDSGAFRPPIPVIPTGSKSARSDDSIFPTRIFHF